MDKKGNVIVPAKYYSVADFKEGRAWVANEDNHDHAWCGYIDLDGKEVVPIINTESLLKKDTKP